MLTITRINLTMVNFEYPKDKETLSTWLKDHENEVDINNLVYGSGYWFTLNEPYKYNLTNKEKRSLESQSLKGLLMTVDNKYMEV